MKARLNSCAARPPRHPAPELRIWLGAMLWLVLSATVSHAELPAPELSYELTRLDAPLPAPDFTLEDMDGQRHSLSDYRGKVVMLNFWAIPRIGIWQKMWTKRQKSY